MRPTPGRLALLGIVIAAATLAGYVLLLDHAGIRNRLASSGACDDGPCLTP